MTGIQLYIAVASPEDTSNGYKCLPFSQRSHRKQLLISGCLRPLAEMTCGQPLICSFFFSFLLIQGLSGCCDLFRSGRLKNRAFSHHAFLKQRRRAFSKEEFLHDLYTTSESISKIFSIIQLLTSELPLYFEFIK